jgi:tetratricopeptide (TPR) repeat protein
MKPCHKLLITLSFILIRANAFSQSNDAQALVDAGVALFDKGSYNEAIEKYQEALKINPNDLRADYEMAYTLQIINKGLDGIPYLEKILQSDGAKFEAHELLGSIYDDNNQPEKAVDEYLAGVKEKPDFALLHLNLAITYTRLKKYAEAESEAIESVKLDPKHASNHRIYAIATYKEGKRACSLLGWCNFLLLEPQSKRSAEGLAYIKNILNYGITKTGEKKVTVRVSTADLSSINLGMQMAVVTATDKKENLSPVDSLALQLNSVFQIIGEKSGTLETPFFSKYYAKYFQKLADSGNTPAFVHYISLSAFKDEDSTWFKEHDKELKDLDKWVSSTERDF